ncbi:MAG: hypothetical protein ACLUS6_11910 [Dysosmobacter sp.]
MRSIFALLIKNRWTEILADGARLGYHPQEDGLLMWERCIPVPHQRKRIFVEAGGRLHGTAH